ncbi:peptidoglycan D,D-transpeptidase FtsI family protein [Phorcysia thermohydrogeniphila]|uniref:Cell division protein FtsI (Penicillin-binding protein 3) n=1 Tax=Phorcysia thermohydrogeniphila TaxID=936138 RepID=A0A4R1GHV8_9BACT|nr:penicillin-binding protein 2 [Phorcysia thermohydrogeniphila]TCK06630.1 cell division protein FtsI (penicillin-binding protein 3) [Phorcysia thermohydrogeniphila]
MRILLKLKELLLRLYNFVKPFKDDRLNLFLFVSIVLVFIYLGKLYLLTFSQREFWINLVEKQFAGAIKISSERGEILDRNRALLAASERVISFYVRPSEIKDKELFKRILLRDKDVIEDYAREKGLSSEKIKKSLSVFENISPKDIDFAYKKEFTIVKKDGKTIKVPFVWLKKRISCSRKEAYRAVRTALNIYYYLSKEDRFKKRYPDLLGYVTEFKRVYPYSTGSVVVGLTNRSGEGLSGLEYLLERRKIITGDTITLSGEKDTRGRVYLGKEARLFLSRQKGNNVVITIDGNLQYIFEKTIEEFGKKWHPNFINAVLMDPYTGDILAAASYPFYKYGEKRGKKLLSKLNARFITAPYEPGSVIKPITLAAAINEGLVTADTVFFCPATYQVGKKTFKNEFHGRDVKLRAWEIIQYSDNVGIIKVAQLLGKEKLYEYFKAFGFGEKTGIELPGEDPGVLRHWKKWRDVEFATLSFGHNIMTTTLQLAAAYSALVNGGVYVKPRLLLAIVDDKGKVIKRFPVVKKRRVISERTSKVMRRVLTMVVEGGTGTGTRFENFYVGGKTGTAVKYDPKIKAYNKQKITASFVGAFPMTNPRFVLAVTVDEPKVPKRELWASKIAVPLFRELAERVLLYERVAPDKKEYRVGKDGAILCSEINRDYLLTNGLQTEK